MIVTGIAKDIISGEEPKNTVTDTKAYEEALKQTGYTHEEAQRYWSNPSNADPLARVQKEINIASNTQVPRVVVDNGKVSISAPQALWESPVVNQLKEELQQLKGVDLSSPNVTNAINALNDELRNSWKNSMIEETLGWTPEEYKDYQYAIQAVSGTNPLKSTAKLKWAKDGNVIVDSDNKPVYKTPAEWLEYWQKNYGADERNQLFKKSLQSSNPYERTMALVMAQGQEKPVYGFSDSERFAQGVNAWWNQLMKLPEGIVRTVGTDQNTKQLEALSKQLNVSADNLLKATMTNEEQFNQKKEELKNKMWSELSDSDKAFLMTLGVSKEKGSVLNVTDRAIRAGFPSSQGKNVQKDLRDMSSEDEATSKYAINNILAESSFDDYKKTHDNYVTWQNYDEDRSEDEKKMAENANWASSEQTLGNIAGTVGRYLWETAVTKGLTGGISAKSLTNPKLVKGTPGGFAGKGINLNNVSDYLGDKMVATLKKVGLSPASSVGQGALKFAADLIGTIPEDVIQTSFDNVLTYNADENKNLLDWENMSENFKWNFITMAGFNAAKAGLNAARRVRIANQLKKIADLDSPIRIDGIMADADDAARAIKNGGTVKVEGDKVSAVSPDGTEIELKNITPEAGEMIVRNSGSDEAIAAHNTKVAQQRVDNALTRIQKIVESNNVSADAVDELYKAKRAIDLAYGKLSADDLWSIKNQAGKLWKNIHDAGYELADYTGMKYNDGMNVDILEVKGNPNADTLYISEVSKPAILKDGQIVRRAEVTLSSEKPNIDRLDVFDKTPSTYEGKQMLDESPESTPSSEYDSIADYYRKAKNKETVLVYMSPAEYLEALMEENGGPYKNIDEIIRRSRSGDEADSLIKYAERMANMDFNPGVGDGKIPALRLEYDQNGYYNQEGIHRALAAANIGVEKVPVAVEYPYEGRPAIVDDILKGKEVVKADIDSTPKSSGTSGGDIETPKLDTSEIDTTKIETEEPKKILIETGSPNGRVMAEVPDYNFKTPTEILKTNLDPTPAGLKYGIAKGVDAAMKPFDSYLTEFRNKFPDVQESDFDWVFYKSKQGLTPDEIIGTTDPTTGRVVNQNMIDAMEWWGDQPFNKDFRLASRGALGLEGDKNVLGYLTHTEYDPTNLSYDEALNGALWKESTGASMTTDGNYTGYGGTFKDRYRTFVKNMLWDAKVNDVTTAKLIEEAELDGKPVTPELIEEAKKADKGGREIISKVNESENTKQLTNALSSDSEDIDWKGLDEERQKAAQNSGLGQATHDVYAPIYMRSNSKGVKKQPKTLGNTFDSLGNNMRNIQLEGGATMYDWGGADIVYAHGNAIELVNRYTSEGGNFREMLIDFVETHSHRSPEYAEAVVDRWMKRIGSIPGEMTKGKVIAELANCMKSEGMSRLRKFLTMAKYDEFNASTKKTIDEFLFNHMQMESIKRNPTIGKKITKALEVATSYRYRALFYGNFKNALLQISELSRLFTTFKWGDVAKMAKRLATDEAFRAKVDVYVDAVAPQTNRLNAELYGKYAKAAENLEVKENGIQFKNLQDTIDDVALAPINAAETYKNRMMVAALVQEAESLGLSGNEALSHIRKRFERVALAMNEMGRIGLSSNPLARTMLFLQNFQIRELGMHYYNFLDETAMGKTIPKKLFNQFKYLSKVFGTKLATTLVLSRIGYSATQTLGVDPFGLMDTYNKMDEDEMTDLDRMISNGVLTPFVSGGMTSLLADLYFMCRNAYEDSVRTTVSEEAEQELNKPGFWEQFGRFKLPDDMLSFDNVMGAASNFIPGNTFAKRLTQMNQMMDSGWATSASGNKMYTAPDDIINTLLGYLFGRSATANAQQYQQTYGDNIWQTLGRMVPGRSWGDFDPIDDKYYTDWFRGNENDKQQFAKGIYWFKAQRDNILDTYENAIKNSYDNDQVSEAKNNMNQHLDELYTQLERFVDAYENRNGSIDANMTKQVINVLNTGRKVLGDTADDAEQRSLEDYAQALERYSMLGMSPVGTYTGPTVDNPDKEVKYQGSPQWRAAVSGYHDSDKEAVVVLKEADKVLAPIRKGLQDSLSKAYDTANKTGNYDAVTKIQKQYLKEFDNVVSPIIAAYGNNILKSTKVADQLRDMLSTGTNKKSANLIPSEQYAKNKWGRYQSMEKESVDVGKWSQERFSGDLYKNPTITSNSTAGEDLVEIRKLIRRGQNDRARAKALQLKVRVDNQTRSLSADDYKWLESYLNYKEGK